jgi:hypothetical protein
MSRSRSSHRKHKHRKHRVGGAWDSVDEFRREMGADVAGISDDEIKTMLLTDNKNVLANKQFEHEKRLKEEQNKYSQLQREKEQADNMRKSAEINLQFEKQKSPLLHHTIYERRTPVFDLYDVNRYLRKENSRFTDQLEDEKRRERLEKEKLKEELEKEKLRRSLLKLKSKKSKSRSRSKSRSKTKPRSKSKSMSKSH